MAQLVQFSLYSVENKVATVTTTSFLQTTHRGTLLSSTKEIRSTVVATSRGSHAVNLLHTRVHSSESNAAVGVMWNIVVVAVARVQRRGQTKRPLARAACGGNSGLISVKGPPIRPHGTPPRCRPLLLTPLPLSLDSQNEAAPLNYSPFALIPKSLALITPFLLGPCALSPSLLQSSLSFGRIPASIFVLKCNGQHCSSVHFKEDS